MDNQPKFEVFSHPQFGKVATAISEDGEILFKANDVAIALGYKNYKWAVSSHCEGVRVLRTPSENQHGTVTLQPTKYIPESDVYALIFGSKLPGAKEFRRWVFEEVLPCIRKTGAYMTDEVQARAIEDPDFLMKLAKALKEQKQEIREQKRIISEQSVEIENLSSRASYVEQVLACTNLICITQIAQDYGMSARKFNLVLEQLRIQYKVNGQWILFAEYKDAGYVQSATSVDENGRGHLWTYWTQNGRLFLYETLKKQNILPTMEKMMVADINLFSGNYE
mgnify:CR=1 FL=1